MSKRVRNAIAVVIAIIVFSSGATGGVLLDRTLLRRNVAQVDVPAGSASDFALMAEAWQTIKNHYVDQSAATGSNLTTGAIAGMVQSLGDTGHSRYLTPEMVRQENDFTQGQFEGIGAEVQMVDGKLVIVAPIDGSPAQRAGVRAGEVIVQVNGKDIRGLNLEEAIALVMGPAGTSVTVTLEDPTTGSRRDLTIERAKVTIHAVSWSIIPGTTLAHVRVSGFSEGMTDDLRSALEAIQTQAVTGIVLDLRNDPGGLLGKAISSASLFLKAGDVLQERDAAGNITPVPVQAGKFVTDLPMVVLVNNGTASAAEILSSALQDNGRATLLGPTTFGAGTVLNQFSLSDKSAILLATEGWTSPNGTPIWHHGVVPDQVVELPSQTTPVSPDEEKNLTAAALQARNDTQLTAAIQLLTEKASTASELH